MMMSIFIIVLCLFFAFVLLDLLRCYWRLQAYNQTPLKIETFEGSNSPYHPSVLYFEEGWNGYKYYMAETPYSPQSKPYRDRFECPSIHVSNDGINWKTPAGLINPIVNLNEDGVKNLNYYSDPHLVINNNCLECFYRLTERHGKVDLRNEVSLWRAISADGIDWKHEKISQLNCNGSNDGLGAMVVSPALIRKNNLYYIYYVDSELDPRKIVYSSSPDGILWSDKKICTLTGIIINPWHIDVQFFNDIYWLTVYDNSKLTLWKSKNGTEFYFVKTLLSPTVIGSFYSGLYRACLVKIKDGVRLYFSADNYKKTFIGVMSGNSPETLEIISPHGKYCKNLFAFLPFYFEKRYRTSYFILKKYFVGD